MYFVYILQSTKDSTYYIGYTQNVVERLKTHNDGRVRYTKGHTPYALVYQERCANLQEARTREQYMKSLKNTAYFLKNKRVPSIAKAIGTSPERKLFGEIPASPHLQCNVVQC